MSLNKLILIGNLGAKPELKSSQAGDYFTNFSLAVNSKSKDKTGNLIAQSTWFNVTAYGKNAEIICQYLDKGSQLYLEGKVSVSTYQDQKGEIKASLNVALQSFSMLSANNQNLHSENNNTQNLNNNQQITQNDSVNRYGHNNGSDDNNPVF